MSSLLECDRVARGYERAVRAWCGGGESILLDRSLDSLAHLERYLAQVPDSNPHALACYLTMVAVTERGRESDLSPVMPLEQFRHQLARFADRVRTLPMRGQPWQRPRTAVLELQARNEPHDVPGIAARVRALVPELESGEIATFAGLEETDDWAAYDEWEWSQFVDADELRLDVAPDRVRITLTCADSSAVDARLFELFDDLGERLAYSMFGVGYDLDDATVGRYSVDGFAGGLPRWLFFAYGLACELLPDQPRRGRHESVALPASMDWIARLALDPCWPHYHWPEDDRGAGG